MDQKAKAYLLELIDILEGADELLDSTKEQLRAHARTIENED